jgi:hypothetical protein
VVAENRPLQPGSKHIRKQEVGHRAEAIAGGWAPFDGDAQAA